MSFRTKIPLDEAREILAELSAYLEPFCHRMAIGGSVRRESPIVGDIELVVIPKMKSADLFGDRTVATVEDAFKALIGTKLLKVIKNGSKYKQFHYLKTKPATVFDFWMVDPNGFGNQLAIRTGPWQYSKALVTQRCKAGLLDDNYRVKDGFVWRYDAEWVMVPMLEEPDFFELIKGGWVEPKLRGRGFANKI